MNVGDKIRVQRYMMGYPCGTEDFTVETFRHCLGFFESYEHRRAGKFTPLCEMYEPGPESEKDYISNFGEFDTDMVQAWMDLPE